MLPQSLLLSLFFFTFITSSPFCSSSFLDESLSNFFERTPAYDPSTAYPSYLGTIDKERADDFKGSLERYDHLGTPATSLGEVNVEDFRAEGVGDTDDTEVPSAMEMIIHITFSITRLNYDPFSLGFLGIQKSLEGDLFFRHSCACCP